MKVRIKRIDKTIPLPQYQSKGAAGFDFRSRKKIKIPPKSFVKIPGNVCVETPEGYLLLVASRGSTPTKKGLIPGHGVGIGDWDYRGDNDEYFPPVYSPTDNEIVVEKGERIAQGIFIKFDQAKWTEVEKMDNPDRRQD